jgi:hypothetical protein
LGGAGTGAAPGVAETGGRGPAGIPLGLAGPLLLLAHHPLVAAPDGRRTGAWESLLAKLSLAAERTGAADPHGALSVQVGAMCEVGTNG